MDSIEKLPVIPELLRWSVVKELTHQPPSLTVAIGFVLFLALLFLSWNKAVDVSSASRVKFDIYIPVSNSDC
jgi:hypothetical protein